jgi:hypothetical protein
MGGKRQAGCRFLLVTSLLDKQKRSNSPSEGGRKLFAPWPFALRLSATKNKQTRASRLKSLLQLFLQARARC